MLTSSTFGDTLGGHHQSQLEKYLEIPPRNVFLSLEASRSISDDVECTLGSINFEIVLGPRRACLPSFKLTAITDDLYRHTMEVIWIGLEIPLSAGKNYGCTCKYLGGL
jgi:hypothetical protein